VSAVFCVEVIFRGTTLLSRTLGTRLKIFLLRFLRLAERGIDMEEKVKMKMQMGQKLDLRRNVYRQQRMDG
jgi:hypothetical protein